MWIPGLPGLIDWKSLVERARSKICSGDRVLCGILLSLRLEEARGLGTLGVTKDGRLYADPEAVKRFTLGGRRLEELVRVLIHEALHVLFLHPQRCEKLTNKQLCNIAADAIVEAVIEAGLRGDPSLARLLGIFTESGTRLAPRHGSQYYRGLEGLQKILESCGIAWDLVPEMTLEEIYDRLEKCARSKSVNVKIEELELIDAHPWSREMQVVVKPSGGGGRERLEEIAKLAAKMAEEGNKGGGPRGLAGKLPGMAPGEWERVLEELGFRARIDWRQILHRLLERYVPLDYTWRNPSRRTWSLGVYLPGPLKRGWKLAVILDTSGSISEEEYRDFLAALYQLLQDRPVESIVLVEGDAAIQKIRVFTDPPPPAAIEWARRRRGYGGTNFAAVLDKLLSKHPDIDLVIYFTDGFGRYPSKPPSVPIIWVISKEGVKPRDRYWPPFGHVVRIE